MRSIANANTETRRNQTIGLDAVSLIVVAPLSVAAALLVVRRHVAGAALALGIGAYTSYMLVQYILGPEYERLPGNNELLFPLYLVVFALGWIVAAAAWSSTDVERLPRSARRDRRTGRIVLPALAFQLLSLDENRRPFPAPTASSGSAGDGPPTRIDGNDAGPAARRGASSLVINVDPPVPSSPRT